MYNNIRFWLVGLRFNATLTAMVKSWRSVTHKCFLRSNSQPLGHQSDTLTSELPGPGITTLDKYDQ